MLMEPKLTCTCNASVSPQITCEGRSVSQVADRSQPGVSEQTGVCEHAYLKIKTSVNVVKSQNYLVESLSFQSERE